MNRDPYGRGDNGDADPYHVRRPVADQPRRPVARGQSGYGQDGQDPDGHGRAGYDPSGYGRGSWYDDEPYPPSAYGAGGYGSGGYPAGSYPADGYDPNGYGAGGYDPSGYGQDGYPPSGYAQGNGYGSGNGYGPAGYTPEPPPYPGGPAGYPGGPAQYPPEPPYGSGVGYGSGPSGYGSGAGGYGGGPTGYGPSTETYGPGPQSYGPGLDDDLDRAGYDGGRAGVGRAAPGGVGRGGGRRHRRPVEVAERAKRPVQRVMPLWQELPLLLVVAFCLAVLIRTFLLQAFYIPSGSMEETLLIGDRVLVNKIVYDVRQPARGEVVVFKGTDNWAPENQTQQPKGSFVSRLGRTIGDLIGLSEPGEKDFIKRVIGLPGDSVACCDAQGRVTVNGYPLDEPYVTDNSPIDVPPSPGECRSRRFGPITIGPGQMFVMGDHRAVSLDSRCQGPVPIENVIGRAFVIVWPTEEWGGLPVPKTFEKVPRPVAAASVTRPRQDRSGAGERVVALGGNAEIPRSVDVFVPFVWIMSHRRVRHLRTRRDDVGSAS